MYNTHAVKHGMDKNCTFIREVGWERQPQDWGYPTPSFQVQFWGSFTFRFETLTNTCVVEKVKWVNKLRNCCCFFYETFAENGGRALFYFAQKHRGPHAVFLTLLRHLPHACINFLASLTCITRFLPNVANSFRENMSVSVDHSGIKWQ